MTDWFTAGSLYNDFTAVTPPTGWQILAGPLGLLAVLPLIPILRWLARWNRPLSIIAVGMVWLLFTLNPIATAKFLLCVACGALWIVLLGTLRRRGRLSANAMIALVWIGLHAMALPLWLHPQFFSYGWEPGPLATLHALGLAYFLFRFVAWGVHWANNPELPLRPLETLVYVLYPPVMRLGPVLTREAFLERWDAWDPRAAPPWREIGGRALLFLLGGIAYGVVLNNCPRVPGGQPDFFSSPQLYRTDQLVSLVYLVPIRIYLILWMYNELAAITSFWIGIRCDNNFDHLPMATSIRDFWRRWHITVGGWLRTYVYLPLGGNRRHVGLNYLLTFGYCGAWHGASWSFLAWGLLQGIALTIQRQWDRLRARLGWGDTWQGPLWRGLCWLWTVHFAIVTIFIFADFEYCGVRVLGEIARRVFSAPGGP